MSEVTKEDKFVPTGFEIIIKEIYNGYVRAWKAQDTGGRTSIRPTAEEAVAAVREMFWSMTKL